ncbi:MAG TPA: FKBP-type peptidyl-prolyl cis-trans isomerase [Rhizomicrobium sp.]|nr:FKBP-type peptidyl-prolyl cis-trans isomerase [Rhizomicrobium sp.]
MRMGISTLAAAALAVALAAGAQAAAPAPYDPASDPSLSAQANAKFLSDNLHRRGVIHTADGLQYRIIQNGYGKRPGGFDKVTVYYTGKLINGKVFDATEPGLPAQFTVNKLIPGWTEALELMREGDHWEVVLPPQLAYGDRGAGEDIPPGQALVFDLQLIKVEPPDRDHDDQDDNSGQ